MCYLSSAISNRVKLKDKIILKYHTYIDLVTLSVGHYCYFCQQSVYFM